jgi:hypothetical protein
VENALKTVKVAMVQTPIIAPAATTCTSTEVHAFPDAQQGGSPLPEVVNHAPDQPCTATIKEESLSASRDTPFSNRTTHVSEGNNALITCCSPSLITLRSVSLDAPTAPKKAKAIASPARTDSSPNAFPATRKYVPDAPQTTPCSRTQTDNKTASQDAQKSTRAKMDPVLENAPQTAKSAPIRIPASNATPDTPSKTVSARALALVG